jgi:phospholipase C
MLKGISLCLGLLLALNCWAKPDCANQAGSLTDKSRPAGQSDKTNPIEHIVIVMQENHSFDTYFGRLNQPKYYGNQVDGISETMWNATKDGKKIFAHHETNRCVDDPEHGWDAIHHEWNKGKQDGFVLVNGEKAMGYYDERDLPFYYDLANKFAIGDRYFCSTLTQTFPNRFFLYSATAFGHIQNDIPEQAKVEFAQKTIFDVLNEHGISWKYYKDDFGYLNLFQPLYLANRDKIVPVAKFKEDAANNQLPTIAVLDSSWDGEDEHPSANVQMGQHFVAEHLQELMESEAWKTSAFFLTYDEGGGFFDHVAPPEACIPDSIAPKLENTSYPGRYDRLGIRVPFVLISPFAKHHYVSHTTYDHTSILKFIETKFNLPALTARDANANDMSDLFDFAHPDFKTKPDFSLATVSGDCDKK